MSRTTVIIPNYNGIKYLKNCLNSVLSEGTDLGIIVVDNGSTDGSLPLLQTYQKAKVISFPKNLGFSAAVNAGIKAADTEYVFLLNNDTIIQKGTIEALEKACDQNPKIFAGAARMLHMDNPDLLDGAGDFYSALGWARARGKDKPADKYRKSGRVFSACAGAAMYRKALFEQVGYFDEAHFAYLEDIDLGYRANINGYQNIYVPEAKVLHAGSAVSGSRHNKFKVNLASRNSIYLILKNMPFMQIILNLPFLVIGYLIKSAFFLLKGLGGTYLKGLGKGFSLYFQEEGRKKHVKFKFKNVKNYLWIQGQLWINMLRFL